MASLDSSVTTSTSSWLSRQFSSQESPEEKWPDLLIDRRPLPDKRCWREQDPVAVERSNLVRLSQLVVKEVVDVSMRTGVQLEQDHVPLHHLLILIEHCLRHGLRVKKGLLGGKKEVWDLVQLVEKYDVRASDITTSAREMTTTKTNTGRMRVWLRLAVMQKKLADYFKLFMEKRIEILEEFYEPDALMRSEEAVLMTGLLVSLNIVDCNLFIKEEDLDHQDGVIDFSKYLRRKEDIGRTDEVHDETDEKGMAAVIDQKNYVEELNRNLTTSVTNLQAKVESLTNTNALMREDLAISKKKLGKAEQESKVLLEELNQAKAAEERLKSSKTIEQEFSKSFTEPDEIQELKHKVETEIVRRVEVEKELSLEVSMKAEMEMAMKLLEKDVHEKQDTIVSLRAQLEDIKGINLEMYTKLAECEKSLKHKSELILRLETKTTAMADTLQQLDQKFVETEQNYTSAKDSVAQLQTRLEKNGEVIQDLESDVRIEREWRERLQETSMLDRDKISSLKQENDFLKKVSTDYDNVQSDNLKLRDQVKENELTLEELGRELSWTKLQVDTMQEVANIPGAWEKDKDAASCKICAKEFSLSRRKHHCRNCGAIFCDPCSDNKMALASSAKPVRVCDNCYTVLLDRQSKIT